jgi:hypothetical protein
MKKYRVYGAWTVAVAAACMLLLSTQAFSQGLRAGSAGAQELLIPVGSVGAALGGSDMSYTKGVEALHWNPAGAAVLEKRAEVMVSRLNYIADIDLNYVAGVFKAGNFGSIGLSIRTLDFGDIPVTTESSPDGTGEMFSPNYVTLGLSYSRVMTDKINIGGSAKLISERIMAESAAGMAFDFGVQYNTGRGAMFGVALKNIGPNMEFDGNDLEVFTNDQSNRPDAEGENLRIPLADFELPTTLEIGLAYVAGFNESNDVTVSGTFMNNNFGLDEYKVAAEYSLNDMFFLRGSYVFGYSEQEDKLVSSNTSYLFGPAFGAGLNLGLGENFSLSVDYAYRATELFSDNQWFSIRMGF